MKAAWQDCRKAVDGLLVVDKPAGPTSHDVVARVRRALREPRVGHTGTLDPAATGVLVLVLGRATRLAQFLTGSDKSYEAVVRLGFSTDTGDAQGRATGIAVNTARSASLAIDAALNEFRGAFLQQPPAFSAKKINGKRSHKLARARRRDRDDLSPPPLPAPAAVTAHAITVVSVEGERVTLTVDCSAGFYMRSLAHDLGMRLGVGGHLVALRRTRSGNFSLAEALDLDSVERHPERACQLVIPMAAILSGLSPVVLTPEGVRKAIHGRDLGPADVQKGAGPLFKDSRGEGSPVLVRLLDSGGELIGIAGPAVTPGLLHPSVVLV
jgi:tRNA pseudouridine55 synthase